MHVDKIRKTIKHNFLPQNIGNTVTETFAVFVWMGSTIILYLILGQVLPDIEFLGTGKAVNIVASFFISDGLMYSLLFRNLNGLNGEIETGKIANYLLLPTNTMRYIGFRNIQFASMIQIPIALAMLLLWGEYSPISFAFWVISMVVGFLMTFNIWFSVSLISFWIKVGDQASMMYEEIIQMSMFPLQIFLNAKIFLPLLPIAFVASGSMEVLSHNAVWILGIQGSLLIVLVGIRYGLWNLGLKRVRG